MLRREYRLSLLSVLLLSAFVGCYTISSFDAEAYKQAVKLKVETYLLLQNADKPFDDYKTEVTQIKKNLMIALEYSKGRPNNEITTKQWKVLIDKNNSLLGGFIKRWEEENKLNSTFVTEAINQIMDAYDTIITLESGKVRE